MKKQVSHQKSRGNKKLQSAGYDVSIRLSPLIEDFMDFDSLNSLGINRCVVEFLRVNSWIKSWLHDVDFSGYRLKQGGYCHLPLEKKDGNHQEDQDTGDNSLRRCNRTL